MWVATDRRHTAERGRDLMSFTRKWTGRVFLLLLLCGLAPNIGAEDEGDNFSVGDLLRRVSYLRDVDSVESALKLTDSLLIRTPASERILMLRSQLLLRLADTTGAEETLAAILEERPRHTTARIMLAHLDLERGRLDLARARVDSILGVNQSDHRALVVRGRWHEMNNQPDSAVEYYQLAVETLLRKRRMLP